MTQASNILSLADLARKAGSGQAFDKRFQQEQILLGSALRVREQQNQQANAQQQVALQRSQLNQRQQQIDFQQAMAAEAAQREEQQQQTEQTIRQRERDVSNKLRVRELERLESDLDLRQDKFENQVNPPAPTEIEQLTTSRKESLNNITKLQRARDSALENGAPEEMLIALDQEIQSETNNFSETSQRLRKIREPVLKSIEEKQKLAPTPKAEAGPMLKRAYEVSGQSSPLPIPVDESGAKQFDKLKGGMVYYLPQKGHFVWGGKAMIDIPEFIERVPISTPESNRIMDALADIEPGTRKGDKNKFSRLADVAKKESLFNIGNVSF